MNKIDINKIASYFQLDEIMEIYKKLKIKKSWIDYTIGNSDKWNEDKFYADFEAFWATLDNVTKLQCMPGQYKNQVMY